MQTKPLDLALPNRRAVQQLTAALGAVHRLNDAGCLVESISMEADGCLGPLILVDRAPDLPLECAKSKATVVNGQRQRHVFARLGDCAITWPAQRLAAAGGEG